jgi:hypothetical protein
MEHPFIPEPDADELYARAEAKGFPHFWVETPTVRLLLDHREWRQACEEVSPAWRCFLAASLHEHPGGDDMYQPTTAAILAQYWGLCGYTPALYSRLINMGALGLIHPSAAGPLHADPMAPPPERHSPHYLRGGWRAAGESDDFLLTPELLRLARHPALAHVRHAETDARLLDHVRYVLDLPELAWKDVPTALQAAADLATLSMTAQPGYPLYVAG